jgi:hypothetical protein
MHNTKNESDMYRNITNILVASLFLIIVTQSCYKDLGNYKYSDVNRITIDLGNNGFLNQYSSDTLRVDPVLTFENGQESDLSFSWYCNNISIAENKKLEIPVKELTGKRPFIKLKVINNRDNSTFLAGFYVEIIPDYMTGWITLTRKEGRSIISFINQNTYSVYPDFYTMISGKELGPDVIEIKEHWPFDAVAIGSIMVIRHSGEGNIELNGTDLNPLYNTNDFFLSKTLPDDYRCNGEFYMWDYSFILDDNKNLYIRKHQNNRLFQSGVYPNKPMFIPNGVKIDKGWSGPWMSGLTLFYDKTKGALFVGSDFGSVMDMSFINVFPGMPGNYTFINNMGSKELVYVGNIKQGRYSSPFNLIYKDNTSKYYLQNIQVVHQGTFCQVIHMGEREFGNGNINQESIFCQLERKQDYIFFSGGSANKTLYLYEISTSKLSEYYTFGSTVKTISADLTNSSNNVLMVGLEDGSFNFLGITYQNMTNPEGRFLKRVNLGEGLPVSSFYKCGYQYTQF